VAVALSLVLGGAAADAVRAVWRSLAEDGAGRDMLDLGYPPHLTLVVVGDEGQAPQLVDALGSLAPLVPKTLTLGEVRQFADASVTWVSCVGDRTQLDRLHGVAASVIEADAIDPLYQPGSWIPHVTLATAGNAQSLLAHARARWTPRVIARIARIEVARFPPAEVIAGIDLPAE